MNRTVSSSSVPPPPVPPSPKRLPVYGALALIVLLSIGGNLYWLQRNVVQLGHDASAHLTRTLKMAAAMTPLSWNSFLRGLTITDFRPPGLYLAAQPFYAVFGRSIDSAQLANVAILALILVFTFLLADTLLEEQPPRTRSLLALLAAGLAALLPMLLAMSRLFYAETLVALCVVAGVYFLIQSGGFARRSWSLALGAALGVGMLAKWTLPVYLAAPLLLAVWLARADLGMDLSLRRSGHEVGGGGVVSRWGRLSRRPHAPTVFGTLALAVVAAAGVALLLYWPAREYWAQTMLGPWLPVAWFAVWLALFVLLALPSTPLTNLLAALALGAAIAGLWYLPQAGFATTLSEVAFGTGEGDYKPANWLSLNQYTRYFRFFYQHHTGLLIALAILPAGLWPWLRGAFDWWRAWRAGMRSGDGGLVPAASVVPPDLMPLPQREQPDHMPAPQREQPDGVPAAGREQTDHIAAADRAQPDDAPAADRGQPDHMPAPRHRQMDAGRAEQVVWAAAISPFLILIFTSQTSSRNLVPILPLFAVLMAVGLAAYSVRWRYTWAAVWIGVLLLHGALATFDGLHGVRAQTEALWPGQEYSVAPASGVTDPGYWIVPQVLAQITQSGTETTTLGVLLDTAPLHPGSFEYPILAGGLPIDLASLNGPDLRGIRDVVTNQWVLVKDGDNGEMKAPQQAVAAQLLDGAAWFRALYALVQSYPLPDGDTAYLYRRGVGPPDPYQFSTIMGQDVPAIAEAVNRWWSEDATLAFATPETAVWLGTQEIPLAQAVIPQAGADLVLADLDGVQHTLIVLSRYRTPDFQRWLGERFRYIEEVSAGEFTATLYGRVDDPLEPLEPLASGAAWPALRVESLQSRPHVAPGDPLPIDFTLSGALDGAWKVSARLLGPDGAVVAQQDTAALPGPLALTLFVPPDALPGDYMLHFVVYNAETLAPAVDSAGRASTPLGVIKVLE